MQVLFRAAGERDPEPKGEQMNNRNRQGEEPKGGEQEQEHPFGELGDYVPEEILNISFPAAVRGYDRRAVDTYVKRVNRLIAEIKVSASPRAAVRHALQQTEQQVSGLLERARETADEITTSAHREAEAEAEAIRAKAAELLVNANAEADATKTEAAQLLADSKTEAENLLGNAKTEAEDILVRSRLEAENTITRAQGEADERLQRLETELASMRDQTEEQMRAFQADTTVVWEQRLQLLEEIRAMASRLVDLADAAAAREPSEPDLLEALKPKTDAETETQASNRGEVGPPAATLEADEVRDGGPRRAPETNAGSGQPKKATTTRRRRAEGSRNGEH
jgi:DivIVA domain-containing protein